MESVRYRGWNQPTVCDVCIGNAKERIVERHPSHAFMQRLEFLYAFILVHLSFFLSFYLFLLPYPYNIYIYIYIILYTARTHISLFNMPPLVLLLHFLKKIEKDYLRYFFRV